MRSFFLPNWSPPDDPARPLPAEGRPWPSDDDDGDGDDDEEEKGEEEMVEGSRVECHEYSPYSRKYWSGIFGNTGGGQQALKSIKSAHTWTHFYDRDPASKLTHFNT